MQDSANASKKRAKSSATLPPSISRIVHEANEDTAVDMCVDLFNRLVQSSASPDRQNYFGLIYVAKVRPSLFRRAQTLSVLKNFLVNAKPADAVLCLLCCNLLLRGFKDVAEWPLEFVQVYLMDSFRDRVWVDHDLAAKFVYGVSSAFASNLVGTPNCRYNDLQARAKLRQVTVQLVREHLDRTNNVPGLLRALVPLCAYDECRKMAAVKMVTSSWLQDPQLADRYAKALLEALCRSVSTESQSDSDALKYLLFLQPSAQQTATFINEQRSRLLSNNPRFPELALRMTLSSSSDDTFIPDALHGSVNAFPTEAHAARVMGQILGQMCSTPGDVYAERCATRILKHLPRVSRNELTAGLLEFQATPQTLAQVSAVFFLVCPPVDAEQLVGTYLLAVARVVDESSSLFKTLRQYLETNVFPRLQFVNEPILEGIIMLAERWEEFRPLVSKLIIGTPRVRFGGAIGNSSAQHYVQRLLQIHDVVSVALLAIWAPLQCGRAALASDEARSCLTSIVTGSENRTLSALSGPIRLQLQAEAHRIREPDYLVLALQMLPVALDTCPAWLEKIAVEDVNALRGIGAEESLRLLTTVLSHGQRHPLYQFREQLAMQVTNITVATVASTLEKLAHPRLATREAAFYALSLVLGPEWWRHSLWAQHPGSREMLQGVAAKVFEVETDKKRIDVCVQLSGLSPVALPHVMRRRIFRPFVPSVMTSTPPTQPVAPQRTDWSTLLAKPTLQPIPTTTSTLSVEQVPAVAFVPEGSAKRRALDVQFATANISATSNREVIEKEETALPPEQVIRNASQSLLGASSFSYLAERLKARYASSQHTLLEHHFDARHETPIYLFDFSGPSRNAHYERVFANCSTVLKDGATAELVIHEWMNALSHSDPAVVADARAHASGLYICLPEAKQRNLVREFIVTRHGPQVAADMLRAYLVANGYC